MQGHNQEEGLWVGFLSLFFPCSQSLLGGFTLCSSARGGSGGVRGGVLPLASLLGVKVESHRKLRPCSESKPKSLWVPYTRHRLVLSQNE